VGDNSTEQTGELVDLPKDFRPADLDAVDRRILNQLHGDARMTNNALAEAVGNRAFDLSPGRVRRLVDLGVIRGFYTDIDPVAGGIAAAGR